MGVVAVAGTALQPGLTRQPGLASQVRMAGQVFVGAGTAMLASDSVLVLSAWADRWLTFLGCLTLVVLACGQRRDLRRGDAAAAAGLAALVWAAGQPGDPVLRTVVVAWLFALLGSAGCGWSGVVPALGCLHLASLIYALGLALYGRSGLGWVVSEWFSRPEVIPGTPAGVWMCGLQVYAFGALVVAAAALPGHARVLPEAWRRPAGQAVLLAGCLLSAAVVRLGVPTNHLAVSLTHAASLGIVAIAGTVVIPPRLAWRPRLSAAVTLAAAAIAVCPVADGGGRPAVANAVAREESPLSFALWEAGLLDWRLPDAELPGLSNSGMFGLFRRSLERCAGETGGRVAVLEAGPGPAGARAIGLHALRSIKAAMFINPTVTPGADEVQCLKAYVESGGGLLVLGDHTNLGGSREALNAILSFTGIRFNFDSAIPLRDHWRGCLEVRPHPVTGRLDRPPGCELRAQIAVGASLAVSGAAVPVILGRYGFADRGDSLNGGAAAFLGNAARDRGERAGGVVLVAAQEIGGGRVLVFGDTSPFQNGALLLSQDLVSDAVAWVCGLDRAGHRLELAPFEETAGLDFSLSPRGGVALFTDTSLGGLANCLARRQVTAKAVFSDDQWNARLEYLFLVGPTRMDARAAGRLLRYMNCGGRAILCQGYADPQPCQDLLEAVGLMPINVPLGDGGAGCRARHKDAWALSCAAVAAGDTTVMASAFGHPTVVVRRFGRGSLALVGDAGFLLDDNLEGEWTASRRNLVFLDSLLDVLSGTDSYE